MHSYTPAEFPMSGHPYRKVIPFTAGGSVECDTTNSLDPVTQNNVFDEYLLFNIDLGNPDTAAFDTITGVPSSGYLWQRSGISTDVFTASTPPFVIDSDFESGYCANFSTSDYIRYGQSGLNETAWALGLRDFIMEAEIKPVNAASYHKVILANYYSANNGFQWRIEQGGYLVFWIGNGSGFYGAMASDKIEPLTYHKVRVTRTNGTVKLWRDEGSGWVEVGSYSDNTADNKNVSSSSSAYWVVSGYPFSLGSAGFDGKIGYVKVAVGTDSFEYDGFKDQSAIVSLQNHGHLITGENVTGQSNATIADNYDIPFIGSGNESALVDSYRQRFIYSKTFSGGSQGFNAKLSVAGKRGTTEDQSNLQGLLFQYSR